MSVAVHYHRLAHHYQAAESAPAHNLKTPFAKICLDSHNKARASKGVPPLIWDISTEAMAKVWAKEALESKDHTVTESKTVGYNIAKTKSCAHAVKTWMQTVKHWHDNGEPVEKEDLKNAKPYLNVMWENTGMLGCAEHKGYLVCAYNLKGAVEGKLPYGVAKPKST
ncbi:hypothetical protein HDV02_006719 [Globomyces sp. JEL0801]|nr:hypothetical protein HDV02_006719 [Globomyces sp. JEL0801]